MPRRLFKLLFSLGSFILLASIAAYNIANAAVPDPDGSDPTKDDLLFRFVFTGLLGIIIILCSLPLLITPHSKSPSGFPVIPPK